MRRVDRFTCSSHARLVTETRPDVARRHLDIGSPVSAGDLRPESRGHLLQYLARCRASVQWLWLSHHTAMVRRLWSETHGKREPWGRCMRPWLIMTGHRGRLLMFPLHVLKTSCGRYPAAPSPGRDGATDGGSLETASMPKVPGLAASGMACPPKRGKKLNRTAGLNIVECSHRRPVR